MMMIAEEARDMRVQYGEDLAEIAVRLDVPETSLLGLRPCHEAAGFNVAFDIYQSAMILICAECKTPCAAVRVARKHAPS